MINSPKVATYDLQPEMSAIEVTENVIKELKNGISDFVCLNFANPDMVGHTGKYDAIIKAVETIDTCTKSVADCALKNNYSLVIIADHGNADYALNLDNTPNTAHSNNPVPCFVLGTDYKLLSDGILADIAPTILTIMGLEIPEEMTGKNLIK